MSGWCPTPVGTGTSSWCRPDTRGCPGDRKKQAASRSHTAVRERCSFQRGNAVMEKWLCGAHIARIHKAIADGCQLLQTTLTPPGWGQLDEIPHTCTFPRAEISRSVCDSCSLAQDVLQGLALTAHAKCSEMAMEAPKALVPHDFPSWMPRVQ